MEPTPNSACPSDGELREFLDSTPNMTVPSVIAAHIETCDACRGTLDQLTEIANDAWLPSPPAPRPMSFGLPTLPGYEIDAEIGRGGYGVVYRGTQKRIDRPVAVKRLKLGVHADADDRARFFNEAKAAARLTHPHIVPIFEVGEHDGAPFIAMEYLLGGSLAKRLNGGPLPGKQAAAIVRVLAEAVHSAHSSGVVHRDLKPANVLLTVPGEPGEVSSAHIKLADFGTARLLDAGSELTPTQAIIGTPSYMAPEQALGKSRDVGPAADVYSLGAILYELLTGRPPFKAATPFETLLLVRGELPAPVRELQPKAPADLETICQKCLEKQPERRYATAQALADELRRFLAGEPILARPIGALGRLSRWTRRHPRAATMTAAMILLAVSSIISVTILWQRAAERGREIERQKAIVEERERNLRASMDSMVRLVTARRGNQTPITPDEETEISNIVGLYARLIEDPDEDLGGKLNAIEGCEQLAALYWYTGGFGRADELRVRTVVWLEGLSSQYPDSVETKIFLARQYKNCSENSSLIVSRGLAATRLKSIELLRDAIRCGDTKHTTREELAFCLLTDHSRLAAKKDYDGAIALCREAADLCRPRVANVPKRYTSRLLLTNAEASIASVEALRSGDRGLELKSCQMVIDFARWRQIHYPKMLDGAESISLAFVRGARVAWTLGRRDDAIAMLKEGRDLLNAMCAELPQAFSLKETRLRNLAELSLALQAANPSEAETARNEALAFAHGFYKDGRQTADSKRVIIAFLAFHEAHETCDSDYLRKTLAEMDPQEAYLEPRLGHLRVDDVAAYSKAARRNSANPGCLNFEAWLDISACLLRGQMDDARNLAAKAADFQGHFDGLPIHHDLLRAKAARQIAAAERDESEEPRTKSADRRIP